MPKGNECRTLSEVFDDFSDVELRICVKNSNGEKVYVFIDDVKLYDIAYGNEPDILGSILRHFAKDRQVGKKAKK